MVRRFLLLPLLAPWLLVLLVAALNPRPSLSLRLLVWTSPALPIGTWLALVSSGGAVLGLSASALALQGRRQPAARLFGGSRFQPGRRGRRSIDAMNEAVDQGVAVDRPAGATAAGPRRAPGEPAPTVSVPFRVIRRATPSNAAAATPRTHATPGVSAATAGDDGWGEDGDEDW